MIISESEFKAFIDNHPDLTTHGIGVAKGPYSVAIAHADLKNCHYAFLVSCDMLQNRYALSSRFRYDRNSHSYELKHRAEEYARENGGNVYVPEGALVAAALYLQLPYKKSKQSTSITLKVKEVN